MKNLLISLCMLLVVSSAHSQSVLIAGYCDKEGAEVNHLRCEQGVWKRPQDRLKSMQTMVTLKIGDYVRDENGNAYKVVAAGEDHIKLQSPAHK